MKPLEMVLLVAAGAVGGALIMKIPPAQPVPPARDEPENATPPPPPPPEPHKVTLNTGMLLPVRLVDGLSSERNAPGDAFLATLDKELVVDGFVIAERGARVEGRVGAAVGAVIGAAAGGGKGAARLAIRGRLSARCAIAPGPGGTPLPPAVLLMLAS